MEFLKTYQVPPFLSKIRCGNRNDGGYVIVNNLDYDYYISCGIGSDVTFDIDFLNQHPSFLSKGGEGVGIDGTVARPSNFPRSFGFISKNIGPKNDNRYTNLKDIFEKNYTDVFLKMDIEGGEWEWLCENGNEILPNCKQIVIEMHGMIDDSWCGTEQQKLKALERLASTHYLVHVHGNNNGPMSNYQNRPIPHVIELTYLRKDIYTTMNIEPSVNQTPFPVLGLDNPNNTSINDLQIHEWPFVFN